MPVLFVTLVGWIGEYVKGACIFTWLVGDDHYLEAILVLVFVGLAISIAEWIYDNRRSYFPVRTISRQRTCPKSCIVMMISPPSNTEFGKEGVFPIKIGKLTVDENSSDIDGLIDRLVESGVRWNWEQVLRGIRPHIQAPLRKIVLIGSVGDGGSYQYLDACIALIENHLPDDVEISKYGSAVDFEDLDGLMEALEGTIHKLRKEGYRERDICIDATGGKKTTSIGAALTTLVNKTTFQYVQTDQNKEVVSYDIISEAPPVLE